MGEYQDVCKRLLDESDYQPISGKKFRKRSGWRKLGVAFGIDYELVEKKIARDESERVTSAEFVIRAIAPNGRRVDAWGACDSKERCCAPGCSKRHTHCSDKDKPGTCPGWTHFSHANHDIPATAETRAKNRAAADLFGMGEVSAEEVIDSSATDTDKAASKAQQGKIRGLERDLGKVTGPPEPHADWHSYVVHTADKWFSKDVDALTKDEASQLIKAMDDHLKQVQGGGTPEQPTLGSEADEVPF